ncbi:unnamed protein product [Cladocopium goreaui]|uniref:SGNH hydrolase-type esterase domain-containing protein n=1 Tax=Cladocopium goreaui TaxID=2562237 RepID=A0A9P1GA44_9DINO|nr:unnamed protein product [Cladocopium goreaui]
MGHAMGSTSNLAFVLPESLPRLVTTRQSTRPHHGTVPGGSASQSTASASTAAWLCAATVATVAMAHRRGSKARVVSPAVLDGTADNAPKVVLMGDSVLDNFFWLETPKRHLRLQLQDALAKSRNAKVKQLKCVNLAVDQMTTFDFVERKPQDNPWDVYAKARRMVAFEDDEDVYLNAEVKGKLVSSLLPQSEGKRKEVAQEFAKRLKGVLEKVKAGAPDASLILVVPYQPHQDFSLMMGAPINDEGKRIYGDILGDGTRVLERQLLPDLVNPMVIEMIALGREMGCPIIDLSQTLDPSNEEHYGTGEIGKVNELGTPWSGAEPSDVSSDFTAQLLAHAIAEGSKASVYRGLCRQEERGWTMTVKEEKNDWIFEKDYRFGGKPVSSTISRKRQGGEKPMFKLGAFDSFLAGAGVVILINIALLLQGGSPLGFDREEFERQLESQGLKVIPPGDVWDFCGIPTLGPLGPWMIWMMGGQSLKWLRTIGKMATSFSSE